MKFEIFADKVFSSNFFSLVVSNNIHYQSAARAYRVYFLNLWGDLKYFSRFLVVFGLNGSQFKSTL